MGLNIKEIVPKKEIEIPDLNGKTLCIDAFNTLYQFLTTIRQPDGTPLMDSNQNTTSHLSGIFYRNMKLLTQNIKLVYVFDGEAPELKGKTHEERQEVREQAEEKYEEAKNKQDLEAMKRYSSQLVRLDKKMIEESKELLQAMGIAVVQAPGEGEAEAAYLSKKESIYGTASQDYDSLLFGAPRLIQNLTLARRRKTPTGYIEIKPELVELERVLNYLEINLDQLICIGILAGTDYNPKGVPGIGPKKALQLVKKHKQPVLIFKEVEEKIQNMPEEEQFDWKEIFRLFHKADVKEEEVSFPKQNPEKVKEILVDRHDFSQERIEKQLEKLQEFKEKNKQKGLDKWF